MARRTADLSQPLTNSTQLHPFFPTVQILRHRAARRCRRHARRRAVALRSETRCPEDRRAAARHVLGRGRLRRYPPVPGGLRSDGRRSRAGARRRRSPGAGRRHPSLLHQERAALVAPLPPFAKRIWLARRLPLDDLGAHVAEEATGERLREGSELQHPNSCERPCVRNGSGSLLRGQALPGHSRPLATVADSSIGSRRCQSVLRWYAKPALSSRASRHFGAVS